MGISLIADATEEVGNLERVTKELGEAVTLAKQPLVKSTQTPEAPVQSTTEQPVSDESLPPKLRGKTREQIAEMYVNAESTLGRMANDLGTQRNLTDRLLGLKREQDLQSQTPPVTISRQELLAADDPTPALDKFVASRLSRIETEQKQRLDRLEQSLAQQSFASRHPDYAQLANNPEFVAWVQATPFRQRAAQAAVNGDWSAADELFAEYKSQNVGRKSEQRELPDEKQGIEAARKAGLESGTSAGGQPGDGKSGKVYKRSDLIRLRLEDPDTYYSDDFQATIIKAYSEKRVV